MKATIFYMTAVLTMALLMANITLAWFFLATIDIVLISWCKSNIDIRELSKLTGYDIWYKMLH